MILVLTLIGFAFLLGLKTERVGFDVLVAICLFSAAVSALYLFVYFKL